MSQEVERRVFKAISSRHIPSTHIVPGYEPSRCPICSSTAIVHKFIPSPAWTEKKLVSAGIEVKVSHREGEEQRPVYCCAQCGFVISRAFREKEVVSFEVPAKEAYVVEDLGGVLHYLVAGGVEDDAVRPYFGETAILESKRIVPPLPVRAVSSTVGANVTYKTVGGRPAWCEFHEVYETIETKVKWSREYTLSEYDAFASLIRRRGSDYTVKDGVLAYLVSCLRGTKSLITSFLTASEFSLFNVTSPSTVGEALSRIQDLGVTPPEFGGFWRVAQREPSRIDLMYGNLGLVYSYVPVNYILREKEYIIRKEAAERIKQKTDWWKVMDTPRPEIPGQLGLEKWY